MGGVEGDHVTLIHLIEVDISNRVGKTGDWEDRRRRGEDVFEVLLDSITVHRGRHENDFQVGCSQEELLREKKEEVWVD